MSFRRHRVDVPSFTIDRTPLTNGDWLEFVAAGGYRRPELWGDDWTWRQRTRLEQPATWRSCDGEWLIRTLFDELPLARVEGWPVLVSHAEALCLLPLAPAPAAVRARARTGRVHHPGRLRAAVPLGCLPA